MMRPPKLANDCFALPPGVDWTPVDEALDRLRNRLSCVVGTVDIPIARAATRILALPVVATRSNPAVNNCAVDGYGFAISSLGEGVQTLRLVQGRSAAGQPFGGTVPKGFAVRILTGAQVPAGVDTVVMQEDVTTAADQISFHGGLKKGANTRRAGEDVLSGQTLFQTGHVLKPQDLALIAAADVAQLCAHQRLRVGVLSTGDELRAPGQRATKSQVFDANRPMLLAMIGRWGFDAVDLGQVKDDTDSLRASLNIATRKVDVILTSGGASSGDEDHVSALLKSEGNLQNWRIALKPGRPLALGQWQGVPIFGLPGNPVAAFICTLIFARPALGVLAGGHWSRPQSFQIEAAFSRAKKSGRREYLRARITDGGQVEVFASEGSGRISGLAWADGLVELPDQAQTISPGDPVTYVPFSSFGL